MKKLHLLKAEERSYYLSEGKGERVDYLYIPDECTAKALKEDVENGASPFAELQKLVEKTRGELSRIVVLRGNNQETLYMAATYLAGIGNEKSHEAYGEDIEDMIDWEQGFEDYDYSEEEEPEEWEELSCRLPLIKSGELFRHGGDTNVTPFGGDFVSLGIQPTLNTQPYWMSCRKEPVAVLFNKAEERFRVFSPGMDVSYAKLLERFQRNRRVFVLMLEEDNRASGFDDDDDELQGNDWEQNILRLLLETTADSVWIKTEEKELEDYRQIQFENWLQRLGMTLAPKFPTEDVCKRIVALTEKNKSYLLEKVLCYIRKERRKESSVPLEEPEFDVLRQFKSIAEKDMFGKEGTHLQRMEKELVGMETVKKQIRNLVQTMKYAKQREKMGLGRSGIHNTHLLIGAPGTAKTSIGKLLGNAMAEEGLLPDNRFISINGADLKGKFVGHSAPKTHALFEQYDIILIDEAYSLTSGVKGEVDSFGQEALAQLMIELEAHTMDKLVLFAGYGGTGVTEKDNKMKAFLDANPGLKSRINTTIFFDSYTPQEMVQIVHCQATLQKYTLSDGADEMMREYFAERVKAEDFGNGREARSLLENTVISAAARVMELPEKKRTRKVMQELTAEDVKEAIQRLSAGNLMQRGRERKVCGF